MKQPPVLPMPTDERKCDRGALCGCAGDPARREDCEHFHMPMPRSISRRSNARTDFRDDGIHRQMQRIGSDTSKSKPKLNYDGRS